MVIFGNIWQDSAESGKIICYTVYMHIPPQYTITSDMLSLISKIDALRLFISSYEVTVPIKEKIQRNSILKSSLFSARIEGNPLDMEAVMRSEEQDKKTEVFNVFKGIQYIDKTIKVNKPIELKTINRLHETVVKNLRTDGGQVRKEMSAIFNQAGVVVYQPPPPTQIMLLLDQLLQYANSAFEKFPLIKGFIVHLVFEKIHPYIDGNGRVGRLLILTVLKNSGYDFGILIPFEEYLDKHREDYYYYLDQGMQDTNSYLLFMLRAFLSQCEDTQQLILKEMHTKEVINLPPRQEEIYTIIREHTIVSLDFIKRRFLKVPERTLRYDLTKLIEQNYVVKIGKTRGSYYKIKE